MNKKSRLLLLWMGGLCLWGGMHCAFYPDQEILVVLPAAPDCWDPLEPLSYELKYFSKGYRVHSLKIGPHTTRVSLGSVRMNNFPVLAYPQLDGGFKGVKPAGGLIDRAALASGRIQLTWEDGFLAELMLKFLALNQEKALVFNSGRLRRELLAASGNNPWRLNMEQMLSQLSQGSFRVTSIKLKPCFSLVLEPGPGQWLSNNPLDKPFEAGDSLLLDALPAGFHSFLEPDTRDWFVLSVSEKGWNYLHPSRGVVESGSW